jgi:hypothetical protein
MDRRTTCNICSCVRVRSLSEERRDSRPSTYFTTPVGIPAMKSRLSKLSRIKHDHTLVCVSCGATIFNLRIMLSNRVLGLSPNMSSESEFNWWGEMSAAYVRGRMGSTREGLATVRRRRTFNQVPAGSISDFWINVNSLLLKPVFAMMRTMFPSTCKSGLPSQREMISRISSVAVGCIRSICLRIFVFCRTVKYASLLAWFAHVPFASGRTVSGW